MQLGARAPIPEFNSNLSSSLGSISSPTLGSSFLQISTEDLISSLGLTLKDLDKSELDDQVKCSFGDNYS